MSSPSDRDPMDRLARAYERMLERVHAAWEKAEQNTLPRLRENLAQAREKAIELGELTREEADRVSSYVERDVKDAASYLANNQKALADWLHFDLQLIEQRLRDLFFNVADRTSVELQALAAQASLYHTGEVTGPGTLTCTGCGKTLQFHKAGHIPPCPKCHTTEFRRTAPEQPSPTVSPPSS